MKNKSGVSPFFHFIIHVVLISRDSGGASGRICLPLSISYNPSFACFSYNESPVNRM